MMFVKIIVFVENYMVSRKESDYFEAVVMLQKGGWERGFFCMGIDRKIVEMCS